MDENVQRTEHAAAEIVKLCTALGLSRKEVATSCFAVAINHLKVTGVSHSRAQFAFDVLWHYREGKITDGVLVPDVLVPDKEETPQ